MMVPIDFAHAKTIVEFGPGTGSFTETLITCRQPGTTLLLIEYNEAFCHVLARRFAGQPNIIIEQGSAATIGALLKKHGLPNEADYIVSGLPFASLPRKESNTILAEAVRHLRQDGAFITFQYTGLMRLLFDNYFPSITVRREWRNLPPAYILECRAN
jgi:phospholipid N-methyltransferase